MNSDTAGNALVGLTGTLIAFIAPQTAAIFAGVATGCWMFWQLGAAIYDRAKSARRRDESGN